MISVTKLRKELFKVMDQVANSGQPVFVERNGVRIKISRDEENKLSKIERMRNYKGPSVLKVPIEEIENLDWSDTWKPHL